MAGPRKSGPPAQRVRVAERRDRAVQMSLAGADWQSIADALGYASRGAAHTDVSRALKERREILGLSVDEYREREDNRLNAVMAKVWGILEATHPLVQAGKVVLDEEGRPLLDVGPVLAAAAQIVRISESLRRLHGLDAPAKVAITGVVSHSYGVDIEQV